MLAWPRTLCLGRLQGRNTQTPLPFSLFSDQGALHPLCYLCLGMFSALLRLPQSEQKGAKQQLIIALMAPASRGASRGPPRSTGAAPDGSGGARGAPLFASGIRVEPFHPP